MNIVYQYHAYEACQAYGHRRQLFKEFLPVSYQSAYGEAEHRVVPPKAETGFPENQDIGRAEHEEYGNPDGIGHSGHEQAEHDDVCGYNQLEEPVFQVGMHGEGDHLSEYVHGKLLAVEYEQGYEFDCPVDQQGHK